MGSSPDRPKGPWGTEGKPDFEALVARENALKEIHTQFITAAKKPDTGFQVDINLYDDVNQVLEYQFHDVADWDRASKILDVLTDSANGLLYHPQLTLPQCQIVW